MAIVCKECILLYSDSGEHAIHTSCNVFNMICEICKKEKRGGEYAEYESVPPEYLKQMEETRRLE